MGKLIHYSHTRRYALIIAAIIILLLLTGFTALSSSAESSGYYSGDNPEITHFKIRPKKIDPNRITQVTLDIGFRDTGRNLYGEQGMLGIWVKFSNGKKRWMSVNIPDQRIFRKKKGSFKLNTSLLCEGWDWVDFQLTIKDGDGHEGQNTAVARVLAKENFDGNKQGYKQGDPAYNFTLYNEKGKKVTLDDYKGSVILLNFNATWCGYSRQQAQDQEDLYQLYKDKGLVVLSVLSNNYGVGNAIYEQECKDWSKAFELSFPVMADTLCFVYDAYTGRTFKNTRIFPYTVIIDRDMVIRWRAYGYTENRVNTMTYWLDKLMP